MRTIVFAACAAVVAAAAPAQAAFVTLDPILRGSVAPDGSTPTAGGIAPLANYFTGYDFSDDETRRSFLIFDLSGVSGDLVSAQLSVTFSPAWTSPDPTEGVAAFALSATSVATLKGGSADAAVYGDLGTGLNLGFQTVEQTAAGTTVVQTLGPLWTPVLEAAFGGDFGVGLSLITYSGQTSESEGVFAASGAQPLSLTLEFAEPDTVVPLPAALPALGLGLGALGALGALRRRRGSTPGR